MRLAELDLNWVCSSGSKQALQALHVEAQTRVQPSNYLVAPLLPRPACKACLSLLLQILLGPEPTAKLLIQKETVELPYTTMFGLI